MYRYETHCHSSEVSRCGHASGAEQARFYKAQGFDGIVMTDHFLNANTTVEPEGQPWAETCRQLLAGYEAARAEGDRIGLKVWYGFEYGYDQTDLLVYGLGPEWLRSHEGCHRWDVHTFLKRARADGALIVHAHPFREAHYIRTLRLWPRQTDAVEVVNAGNREGQDGMAELYAAHYGLPVTGGTDNHFAFETTRVAGVETDRPCASLADLTARIRAGEVRPFVYERTAGQP